MLQQDALLPSRNGGMIVEATRPDRKNLSLVSSLEEPNLTWKLLMQIQTLTMSRLDAVQPRI